jgi:hypothetical protein
MNYFSHLFSYNYRCCWLPCFLENILLTNKIKNYTKHFYEFQIFLKSRHRRTLLSLSLVTNGLSTKSDWCEFGLRRMTTMFHCCTQFCLWCHLVRTNCLGNGSWNSEIIQNGKKLIILNLRFIKNTHIRKCSKFYKEKTKKDQSIIDLYKSLIKNYNYAVIIIKALEKFSIAMGFRMHEFIFINNNDCTINSIII